MSFLADLALKVIQWLSGLIVSAIGRWMAWRKTESQVEKKNQQIDDEVKAAQTKEERDNAAKDVFKDI